MLKVTALQPIRIAVNLVTPQRGDPDRNIPPTRQQTATISMQAGEERSDISLVYGFVPPGVTVRNDHEVGQLTPIPHPQSDGEALEHEGKIRIEHLR